MYLILIPLIALLRVYDGATLWDKAPFLYKKDDEGMKPHALIAYGIASLIFAALAFGTVKDNYGLPAWEMLGGSFIVCLASLLCVFAPGHDVVLPTNKKKAPRGDSGLLDKLTYAVTGVVIQKAYDGTKKSEKARMVWGIFRYGVYAVPVAIVLCLLFRSFLPAGFPLVMAVAGITYRKFGETIGHAIAGALFGAGLVLAFFG